MERFHFATPSSAAPCWRWSLGCCGNLGRVLAWPGGVVERSAVGNCPHLSANWLFHTGWCVFITAGKVTEWRRCCCCYHFDVVSEVRRPCLFSIGDPVHGRGGDAGESSSPFLNPMKEGSDFPPASSSWVDRVVITCHLESDRAASRFRSSSTLVNPFLYPLLTLESLFLLLLFFPHKRSTSHTLFFF